MSIEEQSLRDLLSSAYAEACVQSLFDTLRGGAEVKIEMADGSVLMLRTEEEGQVVLREQFQWN